jgi:hypothetical protein
MVEFSIKRINIHHKNNINYMQQDDCGNVDVMIRGSGAHLEMIRHCSIYSIVAALGLLVYGP